ncbi:MAG TPA: hypothetical protein VFZ34_26260 [Blastocatellia bacterium]|nr:hypothetical protein [Blastocatellia bacterium]
MDSSLYIIVGAIVLLVIGWVIFKFFFRLLKHFILAIILGVTVALFWYQPYSSRPDPNIGKFAYGVNSNNFLGVIVADDKEGGSWIVEKSGMKMKYPKSKVLLKDK